VAASPGDDLVFSDAATQTNTTNNFPAGTSFGNIGISGTGYTLAGNGLTLQGGLSDSGGDATVSLPITLGAAQNIVNTSGGTLTVGALDENGYELTLQADYGAITVNGEISGAGGLVVTGGSGVILSAANTYTGATQVNYGTLHIQNAQALGTADGTAARGTTLTGGTLVLDGSFTVTDEMLTASAYGSLANTDINAWTGDIDVLEGTIFNFNVGYGQSLVVGGNLTSTNNYIVQSTGSGLLELAGVNTLNGGMFQVYGGGGSLQVDNSLTGLESIYISSGTLSGTGTVEASIVEVYYSALQMSGAVNSPQLVVVDSSVDPAGSTENGTLETGDVQFQFGSFSAQLNSDTLYDQLKVSGTITLNSALQVTLGYIPSVGQQFTLIDNDGTDPVAGSFLNYAEGSLLVVDDVVFRISYVGGTGNDVVLTRVPAAFWSGDAGDSNWMSGANWVGGVAPSAGDNLFFPDNVPQTDTNNNLPAGTSFGSINITGSGYTLAGNAITLTSGVSDSGLDAVLSVPITLGASQGISNSSSGTLTVGTIDLNGHQLRLEATYATILVEGQVSGAGDLVVPRWYGYGTVILSEANTYTGTTQVDGGNLIIRNALALGAADGTASTGTTLINGGDLTLEGPLTVTDELLTISNSILSSDRSFICSLTAVGTDVWTGNIDVQGDIEFNVVDSLLLSGNLTSTSPHVLRANGLAPPFTLLQLTGTSTLGESQFVAYGMTVQVDGSLTGLESIYVSAPALQGAGTIGARSISVGYGGALWISGTENNPELSILSSSIDPAGATATSTLNTGSVSLSAASFTAQLNGDTEYDQLRVTGTVNLGEGFEASSLQVTLGYTPSVGQQFTLIDNDGTDAVVGTFRGYAEGRLFAVDNVALRISYVGGTGNDVVLTRVPAGFWSGGAGPADTRWRTAANWVDGVAPSPGYPLFFPAGPLQTSTINNFPAGTSFESISIAGWGYTLGGNKINLRGGLFDTGGDATVSLPITLRAAQSITSSSGTLTVGAINQNGYQLTLEADAVITVSGRISGAGGVVKAGGGMVILAAANTYTGTTLVEDGALLIRDSKSLGAANGRAATGTILDGGSLVLDGSLKVSRELLTIRGYANVQSQGKNLWAGNIEVQGETNFYIGYGQSLRVTGNLTSTSVHNLEVSGGLLELSGTNRFNGGELNVYGGSLQIDRSLTGLDYLRVIYGASLQGAGTVGASFVEVAYGGTLQMSGTMRSSQLNVSYASMDPAGTTATAILRTGSVNLYESTFAAQLNSSQKYDQLKVSGTVDLSGTDLQVKLGYAPKIGQKFTLIDNDGADPVVGTFNGYAEGDLVLVGDTAFRISYVGGTGNDVVLTRFAGANL